MFHEHYSWEENLQTASESLNEVIPIGWLTIKESVILHGYICCHFWQQLQIEEHYIIVFDGFHCPHCDAFNSVAYCN